MDLRRRTVVITLVLGCGAAAGVIAMSRYRSTHASRVSDPGSAAQAAVLPRPAPRDESYVGSQACASCHQEIYEKFTSSPMGQSIAPIGQAVQVEDYAAGVIEPPGNRRYQVTRDEKGTRHTEVMLDEQGEPFFEQGEAISFVVGSGRRGRSYLINQDGLLFQSPIAWYSQLGRWDLSPGYSPQNHLRFSRRIDDGCLYCHAGRMHQREAADDRYDEPIFAEAPIGCERCHGPGKRHVEFQTSGARGLSDPIINPAHLEPSKRESVCNQCHLLGRSVIARYGRGFFDFRPGDDLEDVFVVLSQETDARQHASMKAVSQVEQMRSSKCYQAADGALGCVSCHDAHSTPPAEQRDEHYRLRCLTCHQTQGCGLELNVRERPPANNSCIHCHMPTLAAGDVPHTALTDHRILREGKVNDLADRREKEHRATLDVFADADQRLPRAEIDRARGIALMTSAWEKEDPYLAARAQAYLLKLMGPLGSDVSSSLVDIDDIPFLVELGAGFFLLDDADSAEACWRRVLELNPRHETALTGVAKVAEQRSDLATYGEFLDKLGEVNPASGELLSMRVKQQYYGGDRRGAARAAERALAMNPRLVELRKWLAGVYRELGDEEEAKRQGDFLEKMGIPQPDAADPPTK